MDRKIDADEPIDLRTFQIAEEFAARWAKGDFGPDKEAEVGAALNSPEKEDAAYYRALLDTVRVLFFCFCFCFVGRWCIMDAPNGG